MTKKVIVYNKRFNTYEEVEQVIPLSLLKKQNDRIAAEQRYAAQNVCCGFVLPTNGICPECGKHHKIKW